MDLTQHFNETMVYPNFNLSDNFYHVKSILESEIIPIIKNDKLSTLESEYELLNIIRKKVIDLKLFNLFLRKEEFEVLRLKISTDEYEEILPFLPQRNSNLFFLTHVEYGIICEILGRFPSVLPEAFNSVAPDTGNMEVLAKYGNHYQIINYLFPTLKGHVKSAFFMTEKGVASSDARNISTKIIIENQTEIKIPPTTKWWTTNARHPDFEWGLLLGRIDDKNHPKFGIVILEKNKHFKVQLEPVLTVFNYTDEPAGHAICHIETTSGISINKHGLCDEKSKFYSGGEIAQFRLISGRLHHCSRLIGMGYRALSMGVERAKTRKAFGKYLSEFGQTQSKISRGYATLLELKLLLLHIYSFIDNNHEKNNLPINLYSSLIKLDLPIKICRIIDDCQQIYGAEGMANDLSRLYALARSLRIADGPDEVHISRVSDLIVKNSL